MHYILQGLTAFIVFLGISSPLVVISMVYYLKKRLEHKQIMAAIEKGIPLSELVPPKPKPAGPAWIKYVSSGIALIIIGIGFTAYHWTSNLTAVEPKRDIGPLVFVVLFGVGAGAVIRGLLHRKYYVKNNLAAENNAGKNKE